MVHHSEIHQKTTGDPSCVHMFCITSSQIHTYSVTSRYRTLRSGLLAILLGARTLLVTRASLRTERSDAPIGAPNGLPGDPKRPSLHTSEARAHTRVPPGCVCVCVCVCAPRRRRFARYFGVSEGRTPVWDLASFFRVERLCHVGPEGQGLNRSPRS